MSRARCHFCWEKKCSFFFFVDGHFEHPIWRRSHKRDWHGKLPWYKSITGEKLFSKGLPVLSIHLIKGSLYMVCLNLHCFAVMCGPMYQCKKKVGTYCWLKSRVMVHQCCCGMSTWNAAQGITGSLIIC